MLVVCDQCAAEISDAAISCPKCGAPGPSSCLTPRQPPGPPTNYRPQSFITLYLLWAALATLGALFLLIIPLIAGLMAGDDAEHGYFALTTAFFLAGLALSVLAAIVALVLLYRAWAQIQDGFHRTTPGKAVGFLVIPLFNLYWVFIALVSLATGLNAFTSRHRIDAPRTIPGLAIAYCVLILCISIPIFGIFVIPAVMIVQYILFLQLANTSAAIAEGLDARADRAPAIA